MASDGSSSIPEASGTYASILIDSVFATDRKRLQSTPKFLAQHTAGLGLVGVALGGVPVLPRRDSSTGRALFPDVVAAEKAARLAAEACTKSETAQSSAMQSSSVVALRLAKRPRLGPACKTDSEALNEAVGKWVDLLRGVGPHSAFGDKFGERGAEERRFIVGATLVGKSPGTLLKRHQSLSTFAERARQAGFDPFPLQIDTVAKYLADLAEENQGFTRGQALREAIAFAHGHFGVHGSEEVIQSRYVRGLAWASLRKKAPRK